MTKIYDRSMLNLGELCIFQTNTILGQFNIKVGSKIQLII